jgi:hypothetical protein
MTKVQCLLGVWLVTVVSAGVHAQEIVRIRAEQTKLSPNTPIAIQVDFDLANVQNAYCGLEINFGDGNTQTIRAGMNGAQDFPLKLTHSYASPGKYVVRAEGKSVIRGLKSASACQGSAKQLSLIIPDEAAEIAKQEMARKERALVARQIELQQMADKIEQDKNEQASKEQKLREQELKMKRREKEQKEHQVQQKDFPRDKPVSQVTPAPNSVPASNRRTVDGF